MEKRTINSTINDFLCRIGLHRWQVRGKNHLYVYKECARCHCRKGNTHLSLAAILSLVTNENNLFYAYDRGWVAGDNRNPVTTWDELHFYSEDFKWAFLYNAYCEGGLCTDTNIEDTEFICD
jgi:hypothetical protein